MQGLLVNFPSREILLVLDGQFCICGANDTAGMLWETPSKQLYGHLFEKLVEVPNNEYKHVASTLFYLRERRGTISFVTHVVTTPAHPLPFQYKRCSVEWRIRTCNNYYLLAGEIIEKSICAESEHSLHTCGIKTADTSNIYNENALNNVLRRWDVKSNHVYWDSSMERLFGYRAEHVQNNVFWWLQNIHSDDRERVWHGINRFIKGSMVFWCDEYRFRAREGNYLMVVDQMNCIRDSQGHALEVVSGVFNPYQRHQLEELLVTTRAKLLRDINFGVSSFEELRYQTQLTKTITDNTTSGLFMMDARGFPTFINPAAERITGYMLEEIKDKPLHYSVHYLYPNGAPYPMELCPLDNSQATLVAMQNQEEVFVDKFGRLFPVIWSIAPLDKNGKTIGAVIEFRDVTEEKNSERERLHSKLQAEQGRIKAEEAEAHKQNLAKFVDYVCHEIRNPLHGISANADFLWDLFSNLERENADIGQIAIFSEIKWKQAREFLTSIRECVNHQALITNSVLDLSRLEAGKVELERTTFRLDSVVSEAVEILRARFLEARLKVEFDLRHWNTTWVKGDSTRLRQVILNLLSNAIKFTPAEGLIRINGREPDIRKNKVRIQAEVSDNGVGMTENELGVLFQRFSQTKKKLPSKYGGSGLGLNICSEILSLMDGSISVTSDRHQGSSFAFALTLDLASPDDIRIWRAKGKQPSLDARDEGVNQFKHILVAEDNAVNQKIISAYLRKLGYHHTIAGNGQEAVSQFRSSGLAVDMVLMDLEMPIMDGREAAKRIQDTQRLREVQVPIIAFSGNSSTHQIKEALRCGIDDYLTKPCNRKQLSNMIRKWELQRAKHIPDNPTL
jgi:PAS domain S-box-containing protein